MGLLLKERGEQILFVIFELTPIKKGGKQGRWTDDFLYYIPFNCISVMSG